ncbi:hypothetical protein IFVP195_C2160242 [Vibrio parahaemolyticus]
MAILGCERNNGLPSPVDSDLCRLHMTGQS